MSERLTRKEIKQDIREDEVQSFLLTAIERVQDNPSAFVGGVVGVLVLMLGVGGVFGYMNSRNEAANEQLTKAMELYDAPIVEEDADPENPDSPTFADEASRRVKAMEAFQQVSSGSAADVAELYQAEIAIEDGDMAKARQVWEGFLADHGDHVLAMSVRINLIHLDRQEGKAEELAQDLQSQVDGANKTLPEDVLLYELAQTREALGQQEEAVALYQRILDEYPQSPYAGDARRVTTTAS
ncbi:MAG: tetratricopeptide repeat protein [Acidobacteriota bacterium]